MATWDSADLLSRCKLLAARPTVDTATSDTQWYSLLTEAQASWYNTFAAQVPWVLMGPPTLLTSTDGGLTFPLPGCVFPLALEVYESIDGRLLKLCSFHDPNGDLVLEGDHLRAPQGKAVTYTNGPYARWANPPDLLDASHAPSLVPPHCRMLLVYRAVAEWANRGGFRDPRPFYEMEQRFWFGNPGMGDVGVLGALKMQSPWLGAAAINESIGGILDNVSTGSGYSPIRLGQG
jgi:hypothetical protein